ncbi:MAG TPA: glycosyltransferase family 4 protein [Candidatus Nanoarchaeia archaeon]|nr:glycosyltransferase family 4 protein [Candidatus Nanoarchaeia archaeon]
MRIALVCDFYKPAIGGVNQVVEELAKRYVMLGHEVHVFCSDWDKTKRIHLQEEVLDGVQVHRLWHWFRAVNFITVWPQVFFRLLSEKFDIIHSHLTLQPHSFFAAVAAKLRGVPHVHTTHCPWSDAYRSFFGRFMVGVFRLFFARCILWSAEKIVAITPWEDRFIQLYGGSSKKIVHVPNGVADAFFVPVVKNDFRKKLGLLEKMKIVLFFSRFSETKSPESLVLAARQLQHRKDIVFVMIGPDEGRKEQCKALAKGLKNVLILDPLRDRKEVVKMYQAADVYALPSYREGLPLTLFEAYAAGLPVVATPVNGVAFELTNGVNGLFVKDYKDISGLTDALVKIVDSPLLAKKFSSANRKKARDYNWDDIAKRTLALYREVVR